MNKNLSIGILGSTRGTALQALLDLMALNKSPFAINLLISNKKNAYILERAQQNQIPAFFLDPANLTREAYDQSITALLKAHQIDLIVLIGYMRILSAEFVQTWQGKIINIHPSLLPDFAGGMDQAVHEAVLKAGVKETGCTVHFVTEAVDAGPILLQKKCSVLADDTVETLKARVQALEGQALLEAILLMLDH